MSKLIESFKSLPGVVSLISCLSLVGCYQEGPSDEFDSDNSSNLSVLTRSVTKGAIEYPLKIYAFDGNGVCKVSKVVENESDKVNIGLSPGTYRITAVAGYSGWQMPSKDNQNSKISTAEGNYSSSPLAMGHADVVVSGSSTATLQVSMEVASVEVVLNGLSDDVTKVYVSVSRQYGNISLDGTLSEAANTVIDCTKEGDSWTTGKVYVLPGSSESTVLSISVVDDSGTQTFGYTYNSSLKAGVPYVLNGSFSTGFSFSGVIESIGWKDEIVLDFNFGPGINETSGSEQNGNGNNQNNEEKELVSKLPEAGSIWNGHVVANISNTSSTEADILLLSLDEWNKVSSANSTTNATDAADIASAYSEFGMNGWRIPTKEEATSIKNLYFGNSIEKINKVLQEAEGDIITKVEDNGSNARYLCENAYYTYALGETNTGNSLSITQAGASTKYRLRLVKTVSVYINE